MALRAGLPVLSGFREFARAGALMSYGPNVPDLFRRAAEFTDRVLRGAKPADIPVEQPTKFDLVINVTSAMALGLAVRRLVFSSPMTSSAAGELARRGISSCVDFAPQRSPCERS